MTFSMSYDFFRQCRKFSTLSEKSIVVKSHMTFFSIMLFSTLERRATSLHCGDLARLASVEKSIVGKKSYDFFRRMLFSDSVENFRHCRKSHMTFLLSYDFSTLLEGSHLNCQQNSLERSFQVVKFFEKKN